jgi:hypothetical protein
MVTPPPQLESNLCHLVQQQPSTYTHVSFGKLQRVCDQPDFAKIPSQFTLCTMTQREGFVAKVGSYSLSVSMVE